VDIEPSDGFLCGFGALRRRMLLFLLINGGSIAIVHSRIVALRGHHWRSANRPVEQSGQALQTPPHE
jgi:hypothetical protein